MFVEVDGLIFGDVSRQYEGRLDITIHISPCSTLSQLGYDMTQLVAGKVSWDFA